MKTNCNLIFSFCLWLAITPCIGQDLSKAEIFTTVKGSFEKMYPGAQVAEWELEKNNIYEVEFTYNNSEYEANYEEDGKWISTEKELATNEIPVSISESLKASEWASWEIDEVNELSTPERKKFYEVELEQSVNKLFVYFLPDGSLVEKAEKSKF